MNERKNELFINTYAFDTIQIFYIMSRMSHTLITRYFENKIYLIRVSFQFETPLIMRACLDKMHVFF